MKKTATSTSGKAGGRRAAGSARSTPDRKGPEAEVHGDQELARRYGVTAKTVYAWRQAGMPFRAEGRLFVYEVAAIEPWIELHRREATKGLTPAAKVKLAREVARLKQDRLKAAALAREDEAAAGNVLRRDEWELFAIETVQQARDRFLRLPKMLCKHVPRKYHRVLQREGEADVRKICDEMARCLEAGVKD